MCGECLRRRGLRNGIGRREIYICGCGEESMDVILGTIGLRKGHLTWGRDKAEEAKTDWGG